MRTSEFLQRNPLRTYIYMYVNVYMYISAMYNVRLLLYTYAACYAFENYNNSLDNF